MKNERRKVLFTDGMSNDFLLIITDASKEAIEEYCRYHNRMMEEGGHFEMFSTLKAKYYVKELLDSEVDEIKDVEVIGFDEVYDFGQYVSNFRTIKITAGMTQEFEIINTNAPDHVIKAQLMYISACEEEGKEVEQNPYHMIEEFGYEANLIGCQDDFDSEDMEATVIDAEFDYYEFRKVIGYDKVENLGVLES